MATLLTGEHLLLMEVRSADYVQGLLQKSGPPGWIFVAEGWTDTNITDGPIKARLLALYNKFGRDPYGHTKMPFVKALGHAFGRDVDTIQYHIDNQ